MRRRSWHQLGAASLLTVLAACSEGASDPTQGRVAPTQPLSAAGGNSAVAVTATIADDDQSLAPSLQIRSDGGGAYRNSNALISTIDSNGQWNLDSYFARNSTRKIYLDFSRPLPGSGPNGGAAVAIPSGTYEFQARADCPRAPYNTSFLTLAPGQTVNCPLHIGSLFVGAQKYSVHMNPYPGAEGYSWTTSNFVNVTCTSTAGTCSRWTITPSQTAPDGSAANVAALLTYVSTTVKGKTTTTPVKQGDFYMSFRIDVTKP
jgi:hypothetical protein